MFHVERRFGGHTMWEWFHVKRSWMVELLGVMFGVCCLFPVGC